MAGVEAHELRLAGEREEEVVYLLAHFHGEGVRLALHGEIHRYGEAEDGRVLLVLGLRHVELGLLVLLVPLEREPERWVPAAVHVLIEQPVDVAACGLFDRALEIGRGDVGTPVLDDVVADGLPPQFVTEDAADHVQDE